MSQFTMTCSCGDTMTVEAENRDGAVAKFKGMMDEAATGAHMAQKHPGQPVMLPAQCHEMIEKDVMPAA